MFDPRLVRRFLGVAFLLALLVPATLGIGAWREARVRATAEPRGQAAAEATRAFVQEKTTALLEALRAEAEALAAAPRLRRVLADSTAPVPTTDAAALEAVLQREAGSEEAALEVYRRDGALVAWDGFGTPPGSALLRRRLPDSLRTGVVRDGVGRRMLELWVPVRDSVHVLGAIRVLQPAQLAVPVRNRYLRDYDLAETWRTEAPAAFVAAFTGRHPTRANALPLIGLDGRVLGWVAAEPPGAGQLAARVRAMTHQIAGFWAVLLAGWLLVGGWVFAERRRREAMLARRAPRWGRAWMAFGGWALAWIGARYGLLALDLPSRWLDRDIPGAGLFDPAYLASDVGGGLLHSAGDLLLTVAFGAVFAAALLRAALLRTAAATIQRSEPLPRWRGALVALVLLGASGATVAVYAVGVRQAVLDATLGYFERSGPVPEPLTLLVLAALLLGAFAAAAVVAASVLLMRVALTRRGRGVPWLAALGLFAVALGGLYLFIPLAETPPWVAAFLLFLLGGTGAYFLLGRRDRWAWPLTFRGMLLCVLALAPVTYLLMVRAARERSDVLMVEAARDFAEGQDQRAIYALEQIVAEARSEELRPALLAAVLDVRTGRPARPDTLAAGEVLDEDTLQIALDAIVNELVSGSLLASLADYAVGVALLGPTGDTLAAYADASPPDAPPGTPRALKSDPLAFERLRDRYAERASAGIYLARAPVEQRRGTYRYVALGPVLGEGEAPEAWIYARVTPRLARYVAETPFPQVLVPAGLFGDEGADFSYAEYDNGVLVRGRGDAAGAYRLAPSVRRIFYAVDERLPVAIWQREVIDGRAYRAYYRGFPTAQKREVLDVVAVRAPALAYYDHLFYLLRLTVAGVCLGFLLYLAGVPIRRQAGLLTAPRSRFRDKVLTRFLLVGIASVALTGVIGRQVIVEQNRQAVRDLLLQRLQRAESSVTTEAAPGIPIAAAVLRARADQIAASLGVDLHIYLGPTLISTSRPQLVRQRLIDPRLPAEVYRALFAEGKRYAFAPDRIGSFTFTTGYAALADETGRPIGAIAVPTLPEQAALEAEQARMTAYLFGALLVLLLGIFFTTALLANQLTRPFRRLRAGLQAVGAGRVAEPLPVESHDEMGELVETFNRMQGQLAESQRLLARQERELAWREMARQVAHEIKNPLTPMKLSVQQLRRSYRAPGADARPGEQRFASALERITTTLIEQIDALARIAGEFQSFARMPQRRPERLDLSAVVREAATLFEDELHGESAVALHLDLAETPLPVEADRDELRRALINLLKNALQALPEGREGRIVARTWPGPNGYGYAAVKDNGIGIPEEAREKIFQPNFSTKTSGMGLGLAIVQKAVEAGGGTVTFETRDGEGTTFTLQLPLMKEETLAPAD